MENPEEASLPITPAERRMVYWLSAGLSALFLLIATWCWVTIRQDKIAEDQRIQAILESPTIPVGVSYDLDPPAGVSATSRQVQTGVLLNQVPSFSLRESRWVADFFIWFRWEGVGPDPGESFSIVDSTILTRELVAAGMDGSTHYSRYHVVAEIYKFFDVSRFPLSETILTIPVIDLQHPVYELEFLGDEDNSGLSPRLTILQGIEPTDQRVLVKLYTFQTGFGDPAFPPGYNPAYSSLIYAVELSSPGMMFYFKMFLALLVSGLISISVFFIKPTDVDPRFGLGVGALFAASATAYVIASILPPTGGLVLSDMVNVVGILVIFLTVLESILSLYIYDIKDRPEVSRWLDRIMFVIFMVGFVVINAAIPLAALL